MEGKKWMSKQQAEDGARLLNLLSSDGYQVISPRSEINREQAEILGDVSLICDYYFFAWLFPKETKYCHSRPYHGKTYPFSKNFHIVYIFHYPFPKRQILDASKLKKFADDNFKYDENGRKFSMWVENTVGKGEIAIKFLIFPQCF